jgi:hypothetical protein
MRHSVIRIHTEEEEPDYSDIPKMECDWEFLVCSVASEEIPKDAPGPLGKPVDANLCHCMMTGKSVSGVLHLFNKTPADWHAKKQGTAETATCGTNFVAARTTTEQIIDDHITTKWNDTDRPCDLCHLSVSFRFAFRMFAREIATIHV